MKIKQTIQSIALGALLLFPVMAVTSFAQPVAAETSCGGVSTAIISCNKDGKNTENGNVENTGLWQVLIIAINVMTAGVGVLALAGLVYGAVLYTSAGGNPEQVKKARTIFTNVVIGVVAFGAMFTLLNFLVPGGVFN